MNKYENYPIDIIPERIIAAQKSFIPMPPTPIKPQQPKILKEHYVALTICIITIILSITYKFSPIESMWGIKVVLLTLFCISASATVFETIKNKIKSTTNEKENQKFELLMQRYVKECGERKDIETKNTDPVALTEYRRKKVIENLIITNTSLISAHNTKTKYFNYFYKTLKNFFPDNILINYTLEQNLNNNQFTPNYIVANSDLKLYIDIEIDIPYLLDTHHPQDYINKKDYQSIYTRANHDMFFSNAGWIVIHFAEEQIIKYPESCCKHIAQIIFNITDDNTSLQKFNTVKTLTEIPMWNYSQAVILASQNYRENYLPQKPENKSESDFLAEINSKSFEKENATTLQTENEIVAQQKPIIKTSTDNTTIKINNTEPIPVKTQKTTKAKQKLQVAGNYDDDEDIIELEQLETEVVKTEIKPTKQQQTTEILIKYNETPYTQNIETTKLPPLTNNLSQDPLPAPTPEEVEEKESKLLVDEMETYYKNANWKKLIETCNKILETDNQNEIAYLRRACAYGNLGNFKNVISDCQKIISINPKNADAYYNYGVVCLIQKRPQDALENFKNAIKNNIANKNEIYKTIAEICKSQADIENYKNYMRLATKLENNENQPNLQEKTETSKSASKNIKIAESGTSEIVFSNDDEYAITCENPRGYSIFRTSDWKRIHYGEENVTCAAISRNTKFIALGGSRKLTIMNIIDEKITHYAAITNFTGEAKKMFFHPFNNEILFVSDNFSIYKIDLRSRVINKVINDFRMMTISPDMQYVAGKDFSNNIKVFRINVLAEILKIQSNTKTEITSMALSSEAGKLYFSDNEGRINIYNIRISTDEKPINLPYEIPEIKINNNYIAAICDDRKIRIFSTKNNQKIKEIEEKFLPKTICMSNSNKYLAIGNIDENFNIFTL